MNGKVRAELELSKTATSDDARALAEVLPQVSAHELLLVWCGVVWYRRGIYICFF